MKKLLAVAALSLPVLASAQIVNAGFETGDFTGWTVTQGGPENASVINFGNTVYGEVVPAAPGGEKFGLYFVEDTVAQSVAQTTTSAAGLYNWSVQYYLPANGFSNPNDATISLNLGGNVVWSASLASLTPTTWLTASGSNVALGSNFNVTMSFAGGGDDAKDIIVDSITVTAVPEPESFALMAAGLAAVGFLARRRRV